ncbi:MAG: replication-associated recombination protein A [Elusimicrobiota bacterium]
METLFNKNLEKKRPLAFRMKPKSLKNFVGQKHLVGPGKKLRRMLEANRLFSIILYGPPGCGKSAMANIISHQLEAQVIKINAVNSNVAELREVIKRAEVNLESGQQTVLIVDEIHRFNVNQQEALLPDVEAGKLTLVGITTENPFYFISGPLLSRASVFRFHPLKKHEIKEILNNAVKNNGKGLGEYNLDFSEKEKIFDSIASVSEGDARYALNILELAVLSVAGEENNRKKIDREVIKQCIGEKKLHYDKKGDRHYDTISAFIKSIRGSDPDAAVYYLARMLKSGEDPRFIARRIAISASEDVGNADPRGLILANSALEAVEYVGMPEAKIILAQVAIYLAGAPKSNRSYEAISSAQNYIEKRESFDIPEHLTKAGSGSYKYPHDYKYGFVKQKYMVDDEKFYQPTKRGHEKYIRKYLNYLKNESDESEKEKI